MMIRYCSTLFLYGWLLLMLLVRIETCTAFSTTTTTTTTTTRRIGRRITFCPSRLAQLRASASNSSWDVQDDDNKDQVNDNNELVDSEDLDSQVEALLLNYQDDDDEEEDAIPVPTQNHLSNAELAWRYASKPLLRIGSKGAHFTHGNSLRQLMEAHTAVKVKVNTRKYGTLEDAFVVLKELAQESGAPEGIELLQARDGEKTILFGMPGTMEKIERGEFPPPPPPPREETENTDGSDE